MVNKAKYDINSSFPRAALGGIRTHDTLQSRYVRALPTELPGQLSRQGSNQYKTQDEILTTLCMVWRRNISLGTHMYTTNENLLQSSRLGTEV